jgi:hypothetical protein
MVVARALDAIDGRPTERRALLLEQFDCRHDRFVVGVVKAEDPLLRLDGEEEIPRHATQA